MSDKKDYARLAQALRRELLRTKDLMELADLADQIASSDATLDGLIQQAENGKRELAAVQAEITKGKAVIAETKTTVATMLRQADEKATATVREAESKGTAFLDHAKAEAEALVVAQKTTMQEQLQQKFKKLTADIAIADTTLAELQAKVEKATKDARDAERQAQTAQSLLDTIQAQARKIMGGG